MECGECGERFSRFDDARDHFLKTHKAEIIACREELANDWGQVTDDFEIVYQMPGTKSFKARFNKLLNHSDK
jgi:hypothetical protein